MTTRQLATHLYVVTQDGGSFARVISAGSPGAAKVRAMLAYHLPPDAQLTVSHSDDCGGC